MTRRLCLSLFTVAVAASLATRILASAADRGADPILPRFLALDDPTPAQFRSLRHLEVFDESAERRAAMDVWIDADASGFRERVIAEDGSGYIREKVLRASIETERSLWTKGTPRLSAITPSNYEFEERGAQPDGLASLALRPRRRDVLLVDGSIYLNPADGELVRLEGALSKTPSFWTRRVEVVRWYRRIAGFRMPTALEAVAHVRFAGVWTFRMQDDYESVNGQRVGSPQAKTLARAATR